MASSCHVSMDLLCQEIRDASRIAQCLWILFTPCGRAVTAREGTYASTFELCWLADVRHGVLVERGCHLFSFVLTLWWCSWY